MAISPTDFEYIRNLVRTQAAIVLEEDKMYLAETRLLPVAKQAGLLSLGDLVTQLRTQRSGPLHVRVVEAMTTNETSFFRDVRPFEVLRDVILPQVIKRRADTTQINLWCMASSTGQEPYTIAMVLRENFPSLNNWKIRFVASDLSTEVLEKARSGRYSQLEVNRGLSAAYLVKYFQKVGLEWQIKDELRKMVEFCQVNLVGPWPNLPSLDIVFLRNVLIYFNTETKKQILAKLRQYMHPEGYLFLGGAETTLNLDENFTRLNLDRSGCYQLGRK